MNAGGINQDNLTFRFSNDTLDFEASSLRFVRNRGDLLTDESIEKR